MIATDRVLHAISLSQYTAANHQSLDGGECRMMAHRVINETIITIPRPIPRHNPQQLLSPGSVAMVAV